MRSLDLDTLANAVAGGTAAIRAITRLEPAGGPGDKVFPPTYVKERNATTKYATEPRRIDGREVTTVLLDSVASQANRLEEALLEGWRRGELPFPVVQVDFSKQEGLEDLEQITALQAPHRIADALLRDSVLGGTPFRHTTVGKDVTDARPNHATAMFKYCPTALIFGVWDSTGPKGGLGAKFQRCLVSEIVGIDVATGVKTASRLDPAGIQTKAGPVFKHKDPSQDWTVDPKEAELAKGKPIEFSRSGGDGKKGSPSAINHGNIPPSIDAAAGGVTMSHAVQTLVLSLGALRRLRFQTDCSGERLPAEQRDAAEAAARTALAALALAAVVYQRDQGYDLRSRSTLVAKEPLVLDLLGRDGGEPERFSLSRAEAAALLKGAEQKARQLGLGWDPKPVTLTPAPKLAGLIRKSRELAASGEAEDEGG
ncbi:type I-G CRISPR-associated RAMP protein Csb1/Cas7g [Sorangium cellulosum]|uniref:Type I-U CRISPR-associated protein Cas7 n=1 Tax=Sorangium cellulosum TaxID=56 RepID=A0A150QEG4_SORCE|nr:type I-U CRISPR-associated RAMP protein Csb1/Cas7u [Sorangium cellulosum]KYF66262.1 type I-U CRISPR-associated protein Cas7 [Sorangium cellulosum]